MATDYYLQLISNNNDSFDSRARLNFGIVHSCAPKVLRPARRFYVTHHRRAGLNNRYPFKVASSVYIYIIIYITIIIYLSEPKASIFTNYNTTYYYVCCLHTTHSSTLQILRIIFFWFSCVVCVRRLSHRRRPPLRRLLYKCCPWDTHTGFEKSIVCFLTSMHALDRA